MPAHHRLPNILGRLGALAGKVVDLRAVRRRAACGRPAVEHERTAHAVVLNVCEIVKPLILRHRRRPDVIRALDDVHHLRRYLVGVFHRQQARTHGLVDARLVIFLHELTGARTDAIIHPLSHFGTAYRHEFAVRNLAHSVLYFV